MSEPLNHHFVSQVHLKHFFNFKENKIFIYDKLKNNHYYKTTTKTLFSEQQLNTKYRNGAEDNSSLEKELNDYFEKDFGHHIEIIKNFTITRILSDDVFDALIHFAQYGIIAEVRTPRSKKHIDTTLEKGLTELLDGSQQLKYDIESFFNSKNKRYYSNSISYKEYANEAIQVMGSLVFKIQMPQNENDYFLIPDIAAATIRAKINTYFNPDVEEIAYIAIPLTSKLYLHLSSEKLYADNVPDSSVSYCDSSKVEKYNKAMLEYCQSKVACENNDYLKKFIQRNSTIV